MKTVLVILTMCFVISTNAQEKSKEGKVGEKTEYRKLTDFEEYVIVQKGTERPFTGNIQILKGKALTLVKGVALHFINRMTNLAPTVAGQVSTMK